MSEERRSILRSNLDAVEERVSAALRRAGRERSAARIVAVSKTRPAEDIELMAGLLRERGLAPVFGESYVQEWRAKHDSIRSSVEVHLIGALQSNKARDAVQLFDLIESVHSPRIAAELNRRAGALKKRQRVFLQVNISGDAAKAGFSADELPKFIEQEFARHEHLCLDGLMTITQFYEQPEEARGDFAALRELRDRLVSLRGEALLLSMGMSADFEVALEEGADLVRIGTALFGERE